MSRHRARLSRVAVALAAALAAIVGVTAVTGSAASADNGTPGCVARAEFRQARRGMTRAQIAAIFGTRGKQDYVYQGSRGYYSESREYRACTVRYGVRGTVWVDFHRDRFGQPIALESKFAIW